MKKIIVLLLCLAAVLSVFAGCNNKNESDVGVTIPVYLSTEITNFDPAYANLDDASSRIFNLIYEGLFKIDENGKTVKAGAKSVKVLDDPTRNYYAIEIKLNKTYWSDNIQVLAADYIYAWKRLLDPAFRGEGAALLFDIKNARAVSHGDVSIDDLCVYDVAEDVIKIEFEGPTNYEKFYENLASVMLVPLREINVTKVTSDWSTSVSLLTCNGPFCVRNFELGKKLVLERNRYYMRNDEEDSLKKFVKPYRLTIDFAMDAEEALEAYNAGALVYNGELPLSLRAEYKDKVTLKDSMSVLSYVFNTKVAPFDNPDVRLALSSAIDRNKIVEVLTFAKPAEGLVSSGIFNTAYGKKAPTFRGSSEALISASADLDAARQLLTKAGVKGGDIELTVRKTEADVAVAQYVKDVWETLGFNVTIRQLRAKTYENELEYQLVSDEYYTAYENGDFQVISVDNSMLTTDAFGNLAQFAKAFASGKMDLESDTDEEVELVGHISGYYNAEYDAKIEAAFAEKKDLAKRAVLLHEAEAILMKDMPIMPLVELQRATLTSGDIKNVESSYLGYDIFSAATLKNISKYPGNKGYVAAE